MNPAENFLGRALLSQGVKLLLKNPERNIAFLLNWADKIARDPRHKEIIQSFRRYLVEDTTSNWYQLAHRLLAESHPRIRERLAIDFFINASLIGIPKQREMEKKLGVSVPWAILMDPTEKCNLRCLGCWAGDYQQHEELSFDLMDRVLKEAEELGIYFIVLSGGEPLVRKKDIIALAEKHPGQVFHLFTNGTLIDEEFVQEMQRLGNITLVISVEGFEETTDARRGKGVFKRVMHAMDLLREGGAVFGISGTYTRKNTEELASDEFIDLMISKGVSYGWYFTYIPIGRDVDLEYMATPEQRAYMYERVRYFRETKPIFLADFWNDGEATNGCIAGGKRYFHINAAGEVEPCAFVHYSVCNIKNMSLVEALQNPLFKAYQKRQPFNTNLLRPCPIIDNPEMLRDIVKEAHARPTQEHFDLTPDEFAAKLHPYASTWGQISDEIWLAKKEKELASRAE